MDKVKIEQQVRQLIDKYNPDRLSPFPFEKIEAEENFRIVSLKLSDVGNNISGAIVYDKESDDYTIMVNSEDTQTRQYFTKAHEIGHYFLHKDYIKSSSDSLIIDNKALLENHALFGTDQSVESKADREKEVDANIFAANLIMPADLVKEVWYKFKDIERCADIFNVSSLAMSIRLAKLKLID